MILPITYTGFFRIDGDQMLHIHTLPATSDVVDIHRSGIWRYGTFVIYEGGNVEIHTERAYDVNYSWDSFSLERGAAINNRVYIDEPITIKTWFGLSTKTYYPSNTRYITDETGSVSAFRKYVNVPVMVRNTQPR